MTFSPQLASFLPFRDKDACIAARGISREAITRHWNPDFRIRVEDDKSAFYAAFANDLVDRIRSARDEGTRVRRHRARRAGSAVCGGGQNHQPGATEPVPRADLQHGRIRR